MATDQYIYENKEFRDLAWETEKARGSKGVTRFTSQINGKMVYILAVPISNSIPLSDTTAVTEPENLIAENATLDLTDSDNGANMTSEGNPNV